MGRTIWIFGKHAVLETIQNKKRKVLEAVSVKHEPGFSVRDKDWFNKKFGTSANHQFIAAQITEDENLSADIAFNSSRVLILDQITDPHNLGAIIRSAAVFGFYYVIVSKKNSADISATVYKTASGAMEYVDIIQVTNISRTISELKENGFWVIGLDERGSASIDAYDTKNANKIALVIGAEGSGIRRLVKENCDELLYIKSNGKFSTLNASNACCVAMYRFQAKITESK